MWPESFDLVFLGSLFHCSEKSSNETTQNNQEGVNSSPKSKHKKLCKPIDFWQFLQFTWVKLISMHYVIASTSVNQRIVVARSSNSLVGASSHLESPLWGHFDHHLLLSHAVKALTNQKGSFNRKWNILVNKCKSLIHCVIFFLPFRYRWYLQFPNISPTFAQLLRENLQSWEKQVGNLSDRCCCVTNWNCTLVN